MKILSVAPFLLVENNAASWRMWNIARLLQAGGHEVHIVQYISRPISKQQEQNRLDLGSIPNSVVKASFFTTNIKHLTQLAKDNYDLVYGNMHFGAFYSILGRLKGIKLIFDMHGDLVEEFLLTNQDNPVWKHPRKILDYFQYRFVDSAVRHFSSKIICVSNNMIQYLHKKKGVPLERMAYITNGVDLDFFKSANATQSSALRRQLHLEGKFIFGYVGSYDRFQGVENLIKAAEVFTGNDKVAFVIVGGHKKGREGNITFIPQVHRSQVINYYSICDVLAIPFVSHPAGERNSPTKLAEITAMSKPVLITDVPEGAELVKRYKCGVVVKDSSPEQLAKGITYFKSRSKAELKVMGENSRRLAENELNWEKIGDNLIKIVEGFKRK
jgi:glycosyltransferase involved in cell wall biosynthesis